MSQTKSQTVVVTGATGNLGLKMHAHLQDSSFDFRRLCLNPNNEQDVITSDLSRFDSTWADQFAGADTLVHLAGDPKAVASWNSIVPNNVDVTINVFRAAVQHGIRRIIYASSIWVLAGYRHSDCQLKSSLSPKPINPYGASKLFGERLVKSIADEHGIEAVCLRIGACRHVAGNKHSDASRFGRWGQSAWLSDKDFCSAIECSLTATDVGFSILNVTSRNPGSRWDIEEARTRIGYDPQDGQAAEDNFLVRLRETGARLRDLSIPNLTNAIIPPHW